MENLILITSVDNENSTFFFDYIGQPGRNIIIKVWDVSTNLLVFRYKYENIQNVNYYLNTGPNNFKYIKKLRINVYEFDSDNILQELYIQTTNKTIEPQIHGLKIKNNDETAMWQIYHDIFNENEYSRYFDIEDNDVVVDLGANYGLFSLYALKRNPSRIVAIEPEKETFDCLIYNLNNTIVECINIGISNKTGQEKIILDNLSVCQKLTKFDNSSENCQIIDVVDFNDFIHQNNIEKIDFLKVDIEGSEYDLFKTIDDDYLKNNIYKIAFEYHFNENDILFEILDKIEKCNFKIFDKLHSYPSNGMIYAINEYY